MTKDDCNFDIPTTDEEAKAFIIPGDTNAPYALYDMLRQHFGYSIEDALMRVLNTQCHETEKNAGFIEKYGH